MIGNTSLDTTIYQSILSSMGEGIIFADRNDRLAFINGAAEEIRGIRAENYLGRTLLSIHAPYTAPQVELLLHELKSGIISHAKRVLVVKEKIFENSYYPIHDLSGEYQGVLLISRDITEKQKLREENDALREQVVTTPGTDDIIGLSPAMRGVMELIRATASLDSTILITGESGTGKELAARAIHRQSPRSDRPFVTINCAALPESLLEAELFGHERGAFTGAVRDRKGKFELAHGGTIFLDEIGEMPLAAQSRLLRVIQEKTVERLGGGREIGVDVRIVAATNRDLRREVDAGRFREDLYYRLNVIPLHLPPLRERRADIIPLAEWFIRRFAARMGRPVREIAPEVRAALHDYHYPGNVRELENALERAVALCRSDRITLLDLPCEFSRVVGIPCEEGKRSTPVTSLTRARIELEKKAIEQALTITRHRKGEAAKLLNISRKTLWEKMKQFNIS